MQREPLETKIHIVFAVILLVLPVPGCHRRTPLPFEGVLIAGPPIYNGAKLFLNGEYCGTLQTLQNPEPYVVQTLSYRYPDRSQSAWVGLDLTSAISVSDSGTYHLRIELAGFHPNEWSFEHPSPSGQMGRRFFLEPPEPTTRNETEDQNAGKTAA